MNVIRKVTEMRIDYNVDRPFFVTGRDPVKDMYLTVIAFFPDEKAAREGIEGDIVNLPDCAGMIIEIVVPINLEDAINLGRWAKWMTQNL